MLKIIIIKICKELKTSWSTLAVTKECNENIRNKIWIIPKSIECSKNSKEGLTLISYVWLLGLFLLLDLSSVAEIFFSQKF